MCRHGHWQAQCCCFQCSCWVCPAHCLGFVLMLIIYLSQWVQMPQALPSTADHGGHWLCLPACLPGSCCVVGVGVLHITTQVALLSVCAVEQEQWEELVFSQPQQAFYQRMLHHQPRPRLPLSIETYITPPNEADDLVIIQASLVLIGCSLSGTCPLPPHCSLHDDACW